MLLSISHTTELAYSARISETVVEIRMTPRNDEHQTLRGSRIEIGPAASLLEYDDWLGNRVHQFSIVPFHDRVVIQSLSAVQTHRKSVDLDATADRLPFVGGDRRLLDFLRMGDVIVDDPRLADLSRTLGLEENERVGPLMLRVARELRDHVEYKKGVTTSATTLSEVLDAGAGVCQDLAHLAIGLFRRRGIPARYVSGYLYRPGVEELETHAWCEAWLPSTGWVALDPTHCCQADDGHVAIAIGRDYTDVPPNRGVYRGDADETIKATVTIAEVDELPKGLRAPRASSLDVPSYQEGPRLHREQLDYQQEQQQQ